jgi:hypothetical protein
MEENVMAGEKGAFVPSEGFKKAGLQTPSNLAGDIWFSMEPKGPLPVSEMQPMEGQYLSMGGEGGEKLSKTFGDRSKFDKDIGGAAAVGLGRFEAERVIITNDGGKVRTELQSDRKDLKSDTADGCKLTFAPKFSFDIVAKDKDGKELSTQEDIQKKAKLLKLTNIEGFSFKDKDGKEVEVSSVEFRLNKNFGTDMLVIGKDKKERTVRIPDLGVTFVGFRQFLEAGVGLKKEDE